ncbi:MAG: NAD-binding protein [Spirochaetes bacterium]|jgi:Trk K+ transport system NAD-binding subunit|nr:NAD-binding protein [Spirochaetota bacterium]
MKPKHSERLAYWFDNYMAKGPRSIFFALLIVFSAGFITLAIIRVIIGFHVIEGTTGDIETELGVWRIFLQLTDPGNMAQDNDSYWFIRIFAVISGMFGIIFFSAVIAFITTQLDLKLEALKKGRSRVLERDHVLLLGWSNEITDIIRELIIANESESSAAIVILSNVEKEEMDDYLKEQINDRKTTKIITRTGEAGSIKALERVAVTEAKSAIILPTCTHGSTDAEKAHSDAHTLKSTLAVVAACQNQEELPSIVTQVYNESNREIIKSLSPDQITIVDPEDMIAKIIVQTSRSSGLAAVYSSLIGFDGCEFYFTDADWNGMLFRDVHFHYPDGIAIGVRNEDGSIRINPDSDYVLHENDSIIILAEDDSTIHFKSKTVCTPSVFELTDKRIASEKEKVLIIGWNNKAPVIINEFMDYITSDSEIIIVIPPDYSEENKAISEIKSENPKFAIKTVEVDLLNLQQLEKLSPESFNSIIILTANEDNDIERADAATINILLMLRTVIKRKSEKGKAPQIITEVLNSENLELISQAGVNDAVISTKMVSKILSQIAEEPDILQVYEEMFTEEGSEIYLKPLHLYFKDTPNTVTYADLIALSHLREEICIGYRLKANLMSAKDDFGVILNPSKTEVIEIEKIDSLIVIAENEL